jgi:hypothetical protein
MSHCSSPARSVPEQRIKVIAGNAQGRRGDGRSDYPLAQQQTRTVDHRRGLKYPFGRWHILQQAGKNIQRFRRNKFSANPLSREVFGLEQPDACTQSRRCNCTGGSRRTPAHDREIKLGISI